MSKLDELTVKVLRDLLQQICLIEAGEHHRLDAQLLDRAGLGLASHQYGDFQLFAPLLLGFKDGGENCPATVAVEIRILS